MTTAAIAALYVLGGLATKMALGSSRGASWWRIWLIVAVWPAAVACCTAIAGLEALLDRLES